MSKKYKKRKICGNSLFRFISYSYQIDLAKELEPQKILEIGIAADVTGHFLRQHGYEIDTCDIDKSFFPDIVGDIRALPVKDNKYDLVIACEILEHLPWPQDVDAALQELARVTKKNVIISVPYYSSAFEMIIKLPFLYTLFKKRYLDLFFRIRFPFITEKKEKAHFWEIGWKGHPYSGFIKKLEKYFTVKKTVRPILYSYHQFFVLEKKK